MRTTIDLPDELFRRAKSEAALRGRKLKDLIEEGLRTVIDNPQPEETFNVSPPKKPSMHDLAKDLIFKDVDSPPDMSTNPKYFEGFGTIMPGGALLDTGPLVAFLYPRDRYHDWAVERFAAAQAPFLTCEAVLTEGVLSDCPQWSGAGPGDANCRPWRAAVSTSTSRRR